MKTVSFVRVPSLVGLGFAAVVAAHPLHAVVTFSLTDVGDPNIPSYVTPYLPTINNSGQVAYTLISTFPDYSGYFYSAGTLTRIPTLDDHHDLPGHDNFAFDLNDSGYIVGESRINNSSDTSHAYYSPSATSSTDINPGALEAAASGVYNLDRIRGFTENHQQSGGRSSLSDYYTTGYGKATFDRSLRERVVFSDHSLVTDAVFGEMHLISCRNVLIYFDNTLQDRTLKLFNDSLIRKGFLGLGSKESIRFSSQAAAFQDFVPGERIYQKTSDDA